jgi:hypothetical protein
MLMRKNDEATRVRSGARRGRPGHRLAGSAALQHGNQAKEIVTRQKEKTRERDERPRVSQDSKSPARRPAVSPSAPDLAINTGIIDHIAEAERGDQVLTCRKLVGSVIMPGNAETATRHGQHLWQSRQVASLDCSVLSLSRELAAAARIFC